MKTSQVTRLDGCSILVVDDSAPVASLVSDILTGCGATVRKALSGQAALQELTFGQFDLVFLDMVMPEVDGWEVLRAIAARHPELLDRTIIMTGDLNLQNQPYQSYPQSSVPVLTKPFRIAELRNIAARTLHGPAENPYLHAA